MSSGKRDILLGQALDAFQFGGEVAGALRFGKGHINDTYAVYTQQADGSARRYILQRINSSVFTQPYWVMENVIGVTEYLRQKVTANGGDATREVLTLLPAHDGKLHFTDADGYVWRSYWFVEDTTCFMVPQGAAMFKAAARAFGNFNSLLDGYPAHTLHETIPHFHDTPQRFLNFKTAVEQDVAGRKKDCEAEIEFILAREGDCDKLTSLLQAGKLPLRVTHNDTKLSNILMNPVTMEGVCIVDLDTVMPGLSLYDFGDAIRSGAHNATEDEKDLGMVSFSLPLFKSYTEGYLETAGSAMTELEKEMMPWGAKLMTYECGMRFLTDYLQGDVYFKTQRPNHNLDRTRTQLKLVQGMEENWQGMHAVVEQETKKQV